MDEKPEVTTTEQAKAILQQECNTRREACVAEINAVCQKYQCELRPSMLLVPPGNIIAQLDIIAK